MAERKNLDQGKSRICYYDALRFLSFGMIIWYHMLIQLQIQGICGPEKLTGWFANANIHIATTAVALFFMLSGAGLTVSAEKSFSLKDYYKKRFLRLLVPFYVAVIVFYIYHLIRYQTLPGAYYQGTPPWRFVFTLLGMDEWVSMHGHLTFSSTIGEWFLGALIILTVLFPLFRYLMNRWPKVFFTVCTCVYIYVAYNYRSDVAMHMSLLLKGYEFVLGMYLGKYCKRFPDWAKMAAVPVVVFFFCSTTVLNINSAVKITLSALAAFTALSALEPCLQKFGGRTLAKIGGYLYHFYLVHHIVIYILTPPFASYYTTKWSVLVFFMIELAVMVVVTIVVKLLSDLAAKGLKKVLP